MSTDIYFYSYPKKSVSEKVRAEWEKGGWVDHINDVHGEVKNDADELVWFARLRTCSESLDLISPKENGRYHGDVEFPITKEIALQFADNIRDVDYKDQTLPEHVQEDITKLKQIAEMFDFDNNFLCIHTD